MEKIPVVYLEGNTIRGALGGPEWTREELFKAFEQHSMLYIVDVDGLVRDNPHLELYQRLTEWFVLWIDAGPRVWGDVVDDVFAGAERVTIRKELTYNVDLEKIRSMTDASLFEHMHGGQDEKRVSGDLDGVVYAGMLEELQRSFQKKESMKAMMSLKPWYVFESDPTKISFWEDLGCTGVLQEIGGDYVADGF